MEFNQFFIQIGRRVVRLNLLFVTPTGNLLIDFPTTMVSGVLFQPQKISGARVLRMNPVNQFFKTFYGAFLKTSTLLTVVNTALRHSSPPVLAPS